MTTAPKRQPIPFGQYLLLDRVNIGGMAEVWRGKSFGAGGFERVVAIKRILPNIAEDEEFIAMFIDEAKITVQLNHANIAQVYELKQISNSYFIAMEYIPGKDMRAVFDRCRKKGEPAPIPLTCYAIAKCCEGLDYAHRQKDRQGREMTIVHRDVSPQNVLISYDGEVKVIDFGIAKAAGKATKTQAGILKGKFGYMSPEQIRGLPLDRRSDVFGIGICLYELLTGERLFVGDSDFSVLEKVRKVEVLPPTTYNRKIPEVLEKIVLKALAKDVDERYQYASELGDALQRFLITSEAIFSRKDLAQYMKATFAEEYEREKQRMMEYGEIRAPEGMLPSSDEQSYGMGPVPVPSHPASGSSSSAPAPTGAGHHLLPPVTPPSNSVIGAPPTALGRIHSRSGAPVQLTAQKPPHASPPPPAPTIRLTAVAPMLSNEKGENTLLAVKPVILMGGAAGGSVQSAAAFSESENATSLSIPSFGGEMSPALEMKTEPIRLPSASRPMAAAAGNQVEIATVVGLPNALAKRPLRSAVPDQPRPEVITEEVIVKAALAQRRKLLAIASAVVGALVLGVVAVAVVALKSPGPGLLFVEVPVDAVAGVRLSINGKEFLDENQPLRPGPHLVPVTSGRVSVMLAADGYQTVLETVDVKEGNEYTRLQTKMKKK